MMIRLLTFFLSTSMIAGATPWLATSLNSGTETGAVSAVAVDSAGRVHTVYSDPAIASTHNLVYQLRSNGSTGFTPNTDAGAIVDTRPTSSRPLHVSIDVTNDFAVQIAMVDAAGAVRVYEKANTPTATWNVALVSALASSDGDGGISLRSRGDNGVESSALAFTKKEGGGSAGVQFSEQESDGSWRTPIDVFSGTGTGLSPVLVNTGFNFGPRMIVSYSAAGNRIQAAGYAVRAPDFALSWRAPVEVARAFTATRVDAEARDGLVGVAFVSNGIGLDESVRVRYASDDLQGSGSWQVSDVAPASDVNPSVTLDFGPNVALAFDAERNPWVSYTHDVGIPSFRRTTDVFARRQLPGIGWEICLVESVPATGHGLALTDSLSMATGDNGDPALIYERDTSTGISECVFSRPVGAPWQLKSALNPSGSAQRSNPVIAAGADGTLHLATTEPAVGGTIFVSTLSGSSETEESIVSPGIHPFISMTATPDGTVHLVAVRMSDESATTGEIIYSRRSTGGTFSIPELVVGTPGVLEEAEPLPVLLRSDKAGALYLMYNPVGRALRLLKRKGVAGEWADQFTPNFTDPVTNFDLAVRTDGGFVISHISRNGAASFFVLRTNIDPATSELEEGVVTYQWPFSEIISDVSCAILPDGRPIGAWGEGGEIAFAFQNSRGLFTGGPITDGGSFPDATIALAVVGGKTHLFVHSSAGGGTLSDLRLDPDAGLNGEVQVRVIAQPQLDLASPQVQPFSAVIDSAGFPVLAMMLVGEPGSSTESQMIYLARPADGLDNDGDGIPLLLEGAYCLSPDSADSESLLPTGEAIANSGDVLFQHFIRTPAVPLTGSESKGEFIYRYEASLDLKNWFEEVDVPGEIAVFRFTQSSVLGQPSCEISGVESVYFGGFTDTNARRFVRVRVLRDR